MNRKTQLLALATLAVLVAQPHTSPAALAEAGPRISLAAPIDFATGAEPFSTAFNALVGDQLGFQVTNSTLSDGVAVGDFDHDGRQDVAQTNVFAGTVSVFLGDGAAGFSQPRTYPVGAHPGFIVARDLDLDGNLDLAVANSDSDSLAILRGAEDGSFATPLFVPVPKPRNIAIGRFDADGVPDLAVASGAPAPGPVPRSGGVAVFSGNGDGTFGLTQFITHTHSTNNLPVGASFVAAGDFDGSGFDDLAVGVGTSPNAGDRKEGDAKLTGDDLLIFLHRNEAIQPFGASPSQPAIRVGASPGAMTVADWNGDSHLDLATMNYGSGDITTLLGDDHGYFVVKANNVTVGAVPRSLASGDLDGDGIPDLVAASFGASTVSALRGNGDGSFQPAEDFWAGDAPTGVAVGHFNSDDGLDVAVAGLRPDRLSLLLGDPSRPSDGVAITRDTPYGSPTHPTDDPFAAHHTLDVYSPPPHTPSAGMGRPYPVVVYAHGGAGITGDKSAVSYLMRSFARAGIVAVSVDYRLGPGTAPEQVRDFAHAFAWTREHAGDYGADPDNMFAFGHSNGAQLVATFGSDERWVELRRHARGMILAGFPGSVAPSAAQPASLLVTGTDGTDRVSNIGSAAWSAASVALGAESKHVTIPDRDHFTALSHIALEADAGRDAVLSFIRGA